MSMAAGMESASDGARTGRAIVVLGMHRSGTSALAGALNALGAYLGKEADMIPPERSENAHGFWELRTLVRMDDDLLAALDSAWDDPGPLPEGWDRDEALRPWLRELRARWRASLGGHGTWAFKDPRLCRLLPAWIAALSDETEDGLRCLVMIRHPRAVAESLRRRNGFGMNKARALWLRYMLEAERHTRGLRRAFVDYDDLLARPAETLDRALGRLELDELQHRRSERMDELTRFLSPGLRHHSGGDAGGPDARLYGWLLQAARGHEENRLTKEADAIWKDAESPASGGEAARLLAAGEREHLRELTRERHALTLAHAEAVKQRDALARAHAEAVKQRDALARAHAEAVKQRDALMIEIDDAREYQQTLESSYHGVEAKYRELESALREHVWGRWFLRRFHERRE